MFKYLNRRLKNSEKWNNVENCLPFWVADSDYKTSKNIIRALEIRTKHGAFGYDNYNNQALQAIKNHYYNRHCIDLDINMVIIGRGVMEQLAFILEVFTMPGEKILVQTPVYHCFKKVIENVDRTFVSNPLIYHDNYHTFDFLDLEQKFKSGIKFLLLCNPHNPVGRVFTKNELDKLTCLIKKYNIFVISDEIHSDIVLNQNIFTSMLSYRKEIKNLIVLNAPSKTFNIAGLGISFLISSNEKIVDKVKDIIQFRSLNDQNIFGMTSLIVAYNECSKFIDKQNDFIYKNYCLLLKSLNFNFPYIDVLPLEGTYLAWINLTSLTKDDGKIKNILLKHGLLTSSGIDFGDEGSGFIRFNLACSRKILKQGINLLVESLKELVNEIK